MLQWFEAFGKNAIAWLQSALEQLGRSLILLLQAIFTLPQKGFSRTFKIFIYQIYFLGILSLPIILLSGFFVGAVLALQGVKVLSQFGVADLSGQLTVLALLRELSPAVTALLYAGRAGSAITAQIGLMKTTEQLASMEVMGVEPVYHVIAPRFWASFLVIPMLAMLFSVMGVVGAHAVSVLWLHVNESSFWAHIHASVQGHDIYALTIKGLCFSVLVTWASVYQGYASRPTAEGIGYATTKAVVFSSLAVLVANFFLSSLLF